MKHKILIINGPNLNMLGKREPQYYGNETLGETIETLQTRFPDIDIFHFQSNHEGKIIDRIHQTFEEHLSGLVVNLGAFTHYSYAIRDALSMISKPIIEVHISHIFAREEFRHQSVIAPICKGMISGLGRDGYRLAIEAIISLNR